MKILIIGSGGREHALCWKIKQSALVTEIFCAPGNAGIAEDVPCISLSSPEEILTFCTTKMIGLVVIGPEAPLVEGLADILRANGLLVFGPSQRAAQLEASKGFMKDICKKYAIPTAAYARFSDALQAKNYITAQGAPIVVKADGLAAGKGVVVAMTIQEAHEAVEEMFSGKFGAAGNSVVIEEYMEGEEVSFFALCDGETAIEFGSAQDHKRVGEGDTGPNTGGMGTYTPLPLMTEMLRERIMKEIILPTLDAMKAKGAPFKGILFAGLMITSSGPKLIEYNVRFGDPETQSLLFLLKSDIVPLLLASANGTLKNAEKPEFYSGAAMCVVMAAKGYPGEYVKGSVIRGLEKFSPHPTPLPKGEVANIASPSGRGRSAVSTPGEGIKIFHAGTAKKEGEFIATGGRVLGVTARGTTLADAQKHAYAAVDAIHWPEGFCRRDIGWRARV